MLLQHMHCDSLTHHAEKVGHPSLWGQPVCWPFCFGFERAPAACGGVYPHSLPMRCVFYERLRSGVQAVACECAAVLVALGPAAPLQPLPPHQRAAHL
jgi:hypothetical protein